MKNAWGREIDPEREAAVQRAMHLITVDARHMRQPDMFSGVARRLAIVTPEYKPCGEGLPDAEDL